jgi:hypothetical protein
VQAGTAAQRLWQVAIADLLGRHVFAAHVASEHGNRKCRLARQAETCGMRHVNKEAAIAACWSDARLLADSRKAGASHHDPTVLSFAVVPQKCVFWLAP